jgi:endonuclease YncB( thermonuclease family)
MSLPLHVALALAVATWAAAVEVAATVRQTIDGDTVEVALADGTVERLRLLCVDTPESTDNPHGKATPEGAAAKAYMAQIAPPGRVVRLYDDKPALARDRYGRLLAIMLMGEQGNISAQAMLIAMGHSVYWTKYGEAPGPFRHYLTSAQESAAGVQEATSDQQGKGLWRDAFPATLAMAQNGKTSFNPRDTYNAWLAHMKPLWTGMGAMPLQPVELASNTAPRATTPALLNLMDRAPMRMENGDILGADNDGDGRSEPVQVKGYFKQDGTYVRGHARSKPR